MTDQPQAPVPDDKDWTWVLDAPCPECGFVAAEHDMRSLAELIRSTTSGFVTALSGAGARQRPEPGTWSTLEYSAHVRDVHRIFGERMVQALAEHEPMFANWDQDVTALEQRYDLQDPATVAQELVEAAEPVAELYDTVVADQLARVARRSNGSEFTVLTLAQYHLHDVVHHLHDVEGSR